MRYVQLVWASLMWRKMHAVLTLLTVAAAFLLFALIGVVNSVMTEAAGGDDKQVKKGLR